MDNSQIVLLELIKSSLFGTKPVFPDNTDWQAVYTEAAAQTVVPLAEPAVPREHAGMWQEAVLKSKAHYMRCLYEQSNLINLFSDHGIPLVILKGAAAAMYYPDPSLRTMGDIDFLVLPEDFEAARALLSENGYEFYCNYDDERDYAYNKGGVMFELHRKYSDDRLDIENTVTGGIKDAKTHTLGKHCFKTLPEDINGLVILDHIRHHVYSGLGIRQIIDYMMFLSFKTSSGHDINGFLAYVRDANLEKFCKILTKMCVMYFGLPDSYPFCADADGDAALKLFDLILAGGNFGRKAAPYTYRPMDSFTQSVRKEGLLNVLQSAGLANWEAAKKHKFLLPFAFIYQIFRFIKRGISALLHGENLKKDMEAGNEKADFYETLGI